MQRYKILWADDEIDLLKPHILFLQSKGYDVTEVFSGLDAVELIEKNKFDIVFLDENMPGISGLEALSKIKEIDINIPVIMITKSEEEYIMEEAIGSKISDYLIKPLNPNQILISLKKIFENKKLITEKTNLGYQQDFRNIGMAFHDDLDEVEWVDIYKKLIFWELEIDATLNKSMKEVLQSQKQDANSSFYKFVKDNYLSWIENKDGLAPILSNRLMDEYVFPLLKNKPVFFIVIDNLRFDQWKVLEPTVRQYFNVKKEETYFSILPTATGFARNAIFSGLMPQQMKEKHPNWWVEDNDEDGQNKFENEFLTDHLKRKKINVKHSFNKIITSKQGKDLLLQVNNLLNNDLNVVVFNFIDMLSHARTDMKMIRELAPDESAYRSVTLSWFEHSSLLELIKILASKNVSIVLSTDHGTIRVKEPTKIIGDKNTNTNLRYKHGKNLTYEPKHVFEIKKTEMYLLPKQNISTTYVFAKDDYFFAYPNNYNYYVNHYKDTFQHGGISMEEMIVPVIVLEPK